MKLAAPRPERRDRLLKRQALGLGAIVSAFEFSNSSALFVVGEPVFRIDIGACHTFRYTTRNTLLGVALSATSAFLGVLQGVTGVTR